MVSVRQLSFFILSNWLMVGFCLPSGKVLAAPVASDDLYNSVEDLPFYANGGDLINANFEVGAAIVFDGNWTYLDRLENRNGANHGYPTDGSGRGWLDPEFDTASSSVGPWGANNLPLQSGGILGLPGEPDTLFGIDAAGNGENLVSTYLFRNTFTIDASMTTGATWSLEYIIDDGGIFYINGVNVFAANMDPASFDPPGPLTPDTLTVNGSENAQQASLNLNGLLVPGTNYVGVEVHQATLTSTDVGLDLSIRTGDGPTGGFTYFDDVLGTSIPDSAEGSTTATGGFDGSGGLYVRMGGITGSGAGEVSGGWLRTINLAEPATVRVTLRYRLLLDAGYENDEFGTAFLLIDSNFYGNAGSDMLAVITGDGNGGGDDDTGWIQETFDIPLGAGPLNLVVGAYNNKSTAGSEITEAWFDDIHATILGASAGGVLANDSGTNLVVTLDAQPANGAVAMNADGTFTYTPSPNFYGADTFTYHANDGVDDSNIATVTINVAPVNDPPLATNDLFQTEEDMLLTVPANLGVLKNDGDIEGTTLNAYIQSNATNGTVVFELDGGFTYQPSPGFVGTDSFTYVANDGTNNSAVATASIQVTEKNGSIVMADAYSVDKNGQLVVDLSGEPLPQEVFFIDFEAGIPGNLSGVTDVEAVQGFKV